MMTKAAAEKNREIRRLKRELNDKGALLCQAQDKIYEKIRKIEELEDALLRAKQEAEYQKHKRDDKNDLVRELELKIARMSGYIMADRHPAKSRDQVLGMEQEDSEFTSMLGVHFNNGIGRN